MDWKLAMKEERTALMRIVALLFSLAGLAERSAARSRPIRAFVLWVLRRAEAVALDFVDPPFDFAWEDPGANSPAEALLLAMRFRVLAEELEQQANVAFVIDDETDAAERQEFRTRLIARTARFLSVLRDIAHPPHTATRASPQPDTS